MTKPSQLPADVAAALAGMRANRDPRLPAYTVQIRRAGWTQKEIADALGVTRERVRQIEASAQAVPDSPLRGLPRAPTRPAATRVTPPHSREPDVHVLDAALLTGLWIMSSRVRNNTPPDSRARRAADLFDQTAAGLLRNGTTLPDIANAIGTDPRVLRSRLARHGITVTELQGATA